MANGNRTTDSTKAPPAPKAQCFPVQGVGFRYRAQYAAQLLDLTGWVENNWDGTVDLDAQGSAAPLDRLVPTITGTSHWIHIETFTCKSIPPDPAERSFRVRG